VNKPADVLLKGPSHSFYSSRTSRWCTVVCRNE